MQQKTLPPHLQSGRPIFLQQDRQGAGVRVPVDRQRRWLRAYGVIVKPQVRRVRLERRRKVLAGKAEVRRQAFEQMLSDFGGAGIEQVHRFLHMINARRFASRVKTQIRPSMRHVRSSAHPEAHVGTRTHKTLREGCG